MLQKKNNFVSKEWCPSSCPTKKYRRTGNIIIVKRRYYFWISRMACWHNQANLRLGLRDRILRMGMAC